MKYNTNEVLNVIFALQSRFEQIYPLYNHNQTRDCFSYYLEGHCQLFVKILTSIFADAQELKIGEFKEYAHIFSKIDGNYYDIRGLINYEVAHSKYSESDMDYLEYYTMVYGYNETDVDKMITNDLIEYGKNIIKANKTR